MSRTHIPSQRDRTGMTQGDLERLSKELECGVAREEYNEAGQPVYVIYRKAEIKKAESRNEVSENGNGKEQTSEEELDCGGDQSRP